MAGNNIIEKIKEGDDETLRSIYDEHRGPFCAFLRKKYDVEIDQAIEIFQICVIVLYDNIATKKLTQLSSNLRSYLFGIGKNKALEYLRTKQSIYKNQDEILVKLIMKLDHVEQNEVMEQKILRIHKALDKMGESCKKLLDLFYFQKLSMQEIKEDLNYKNVNTAKNLKYKCLQKFKNIYLAFKESNVLK